MDLSVNLRSMNWLTIVGALAAVTASSHAAGAQPPPDPNQVTPAAAPTQTSAADHAGSGAEPGVTARAEPPPSEPPAAPDTKELVRNSRVEVLDARLHSMETQLKLLNQQLAAQAPAEAAEEAPGDRPLVGGPWYIGGTLGLHLDNGNNTQRLLDTAVDDKRYDFSITGLAGKVAIDRAVALGIALRYDRGKVEGTFDTGAGLEDRGRVDQKLSGGPALRHFLPLAGPLFAYYQAVLFFGYEEGVNRVFTDVDTSTVTTYQGYDIGLNVQPGIAVFASKSMAVELGVDVLGVNVAWRDTVTDYTVEGSRTQASFTLDVNLLSLQFAFVGYF